VQLRKAAEECRQKGLNMHVVWPRLVAVVGSARDGGRGGGEVEVEIEVDSGRRGWCFGCVLGCNGW
jgi:hypothetical protein